ncbi:MAG: recombinase family protein, partial [Gammaproteobacteria bacterium]
LARNTRELLDFADFFQKHNADLISLQENIDTGTPSGRLFYTMIAAMAQWEREEITDRIRASISVRAKTGKPLNGRPAFGYQYANHKVQPHPQEAPVRKLMYELFAEHKRKGAVVNALNERGFRNRKGTLFSRKGIEFLLSDPTAKGEYRANYSRLSEDKKQLLYKPESEWVVNQVEPIVSKELWEQCNTILDNRKCAIEPTPGPRVVHPFAGLLTCQCGDKMYVKSNTPKYVCRTCRNKLAIDDMDAIFREHLTGYMLAPERVEAYLNSANKYIADTTARLDTLNGDLHRVKDEGEKVYQLYYAGGITPDQFKVKYGPIDARREQLEKEVAETEAAITVA